MNQKELALRLTALLGSDSVLIMAPMRDQISFRVGGPADFIVMPETSEQLAALLALLRGENIPHYLMGNGSNLLVKDGGYAGVMIKTRNMDAIDVKGDNIIAEAGAMLRKVAEVALRYELSGLEFASGIPGTLGGAVVMNAGAYGGEMKDIITAVEILNEKGGVEIWDNKSCDFGYRHSVVQERDVIVTKVYLQLKPGIGAEIKALMNDYNGRRREKQPLEYPSAGSTFKRPEGFFAGKLIQDCGLMGYRVGGAMVSEKHAGFVVNADNATAGDVLRVIADVQQKVNETFGVKLEREVIVIGEDQNENEA